MITAWNTLESVDQLNEIQEISYQKMQVLFKHSTRCGISMHAYEKLEKNWNFLPDEIDFYYLDLLMYRSISDAIAQKWKITHQSPQIIVIKKGEAIYTSSHHSIDINTIRNNILP